MAEDKFYDIDGYLISRSNLVQQMIQYYEGKLSIGETRVTDFNEGSEIRNLLESFAVDIYFLCELVNRVGEVAFVETAEAGWLDKHGANPWVNLPRDEGSVSKGYVTFTIPDVSSSLVNIPSGTLLVSTENSLDYVTLSDCIISVGDTSASVAVECLTTGVDGNCESGTVTIIADDDLLVNGLTVSNSEAFSGGVDYEDDDDYRERLLAFLRKDDFGSLGYYTSLAESVDGVHDVIFVDATGYTKKILVNGDVKPTPDSVLLDVLEEFTSTENIILTHNFTVDKPSYTSVDLTFNLTVNVEVSESEIIEALSALFNGGSALEGYEFEGLSINESLTSSMVSDCLGMIDDIISIEILYNSSAFTSISPSSNGVLKPGTFTINQSLNE